jgi:hypothetical protein
LFENAQRLIGLEMFFHTVFDNLDVFTARLEDEIRPRADERVARPALAPFDTFQEKGVAVLLEPPGKTKAASRGP